MTDLSSHAKQRCEFGCGPYPDGPDNPNVGGAGFGLVPACPVHGWVCELLDRAAARAEAAEAEAERYREALRVIERDSKLDARKLAAAALQEGEK